MTLSRELSTGPHLGLYDSIFEITKTHKLPSVAELARPGLPMAVIRVGSQSTACMRLPDVYPVCSSKGE